MSVRTRAPGRVLVFDHFWGGFSAAHQQAASTCALLYAIKYEYALYITHLRMHITVSTRGLRCGWLTPTCGSAHARIHENVGIWGVYARLCCQGVHEEFSMVELDRAEKELKYPAPYTLHPELLRFNRLREPWSSVSIRLQTTQSSECFRPVPSSSSRYQIYVRFGGGALSRP